MTYFWLILCEYLMFWNELKMKFLSEIFWMLHRLISLEVLYSCKEVIKYNINYSWEQNVLLTS